MQIKHVATQAASNLLQQQIAAAKQQADTILQNITHTQLEIARFPAGTIYYLNSAGEFHNTQGPAIVSPAGTQIYYINGRLHNTQGPASIYADGRIYYYVCDLGHREDGPASIYADGREVYLLEDQIVQKEDLATYTRSSEFQQLLLNYA